MKTKRIFFSSGSIGPRLRYVVKEIFERRLGFLVAFSDSEDVDPDDFVVGYGNDFGQINIPDSGYLSLGQTIRYNLEDEISSLKKGISCVNGTLSLDLPAIVFWFLSRMEEYDVEFETDSYGRFKSQNSYLVKNNSQNYPIVDFLVKSFSQILIDFGLAIDQKKSEFEISFDIDNPTAFLHKGFWRTSAGFFQDILKLNFSGMAERSRVLLGLTKDPYLNFDAIVKDSDLFQKKPNTFFWIGDYGKNDKGLSWKSDFFSNLIIRHSKKFPVGLHPSFKSYLQSNQLKVEKGRWEILLESKVEISRFHFLRFKLPESYRILVDAGIKEDFSMGFSDISGYRAGTGFSFYWYDLESEIETDLLIHPFFTMDSISKFKYQESATAFVERVQNALNVSEELHSKVHVIFHNEHYAWKGWENLIQRLKSI